MHHRTLEVYACLAGALEDLRPNFFVLLCNMTSATKRRPQQNDDDLVLLRITFQTTMLAGKMKACLCVALAATASGFGSAPGDFVLNPCANPDAFTPQATLPGSCEGIQITDRDVCQNAGCRFSEDPQDADEPCDCGTQELCEGAGGAWSTPPCDIGHHARMSTGKACDDVHVVDAESGDTYQRRFSFWGTACCSDKVPLCCADDDDKLKSDRAWSNRARTASRLTGVHAPKTCTQRATRKRRKFVRGARMTLALRALRRAGSCKRAPARAACARGSAARRPICRGQEGDLDPRRARRSLCRRDCRCWLARKREAVVAMVRGAMMQQARTQVARPPSVPQARPPAPPSVLLSLRIVFVPES